MRPLEVATLILLAPLLYMFYNMVNKAIFADNKRDRYELSLNALKDMRDETD